MAKPLTTKNQARIDKASASGRLPQMLANRPMLAARSETAAVNAKNQAWGDAMRKWQGGGVPPGGDASGGPGMPVPGAAGGGGVIADAPGAGKGPTPKGAQNPPGATAAPPPTAAPPTATPPSLTGNLDTGYGAGAGAAFGPYTPGENPLDAARRLSMLDLSEQLAGQNARLGAQGMGTSSRQSLMTGSAIGRAIAELGDKLAGRGQDQSKIALDAMNTLGQQNLAGRQLDLQRTEMLGRQGQNLTGLGASEQTPMNMEALLALLSGFGPTSQVGKTKQTSHTGSGFLA